MSSCCFCTNSDSFEMRKCDNCGRNICWVHAKHSYDLRSHWSVTVCPNCESLSDFGDLPEANCYHCGQYVDLLKPHIVEDNDDIYHIACYLNKDIKIEDLDKVYSKDFNNIRKACYDAIFSRGVIHFMKNGIEVCPRDKEYNQKDFPESIDASRYQDSNFLKLLENAIKKVIEMKYFNN